MHASFSCVNMLAYAVSVLDDKRQITAGLGYVHILSMIFVVVVMMYDTVGESRTEFERSVCKYCDHISTQ